MKKILASLFMLILCGCSFRSDTIEQTYRCMWNDATSTINSTIYIKTENEYVINYLKEDRMDITSAGYNDEQLDSLIENSKGNIYDGIQGQGIETSAEIEKTDDKTYFVTNLQIDLKVADLEMLKESKVISAYGDEGITVSQFKETIESGNFSCHLE